MQLDREQDPPTPPRCTSPGKVSTSQTTCNSRKHRACAERTRPFRRYVRHESHPRTTTNGTASPGLPSKRPGVVLSGACRRQSGLAVPDGGRVSPPQNMSSTVLGLEVRGLDLRVTHGPLIGPCFQLLKRTSWALAAWFGTWRRRELLQDGWQSDSVAFRTPRRESRRYLSGNCNNNGANSCMFNPSYCCTERIECYLSNMEKEPTNK